MTINGEIATAELDQISQPSQNGTVTLKEANRVLAEERAWLAGIAAERLGYLALSEATINDLIKLQFKSARVLWQITQSEFTQTRREDYLGQYSEMATSLLDSLNRLPADAAVGLVVNSVGSDQPALSHDVVKFAEFRKPTKIDADPETLSTTYWFDRKDLEFDLMHNLAGGNYAALIISTDADRRYESPAYVGEPQKIVLIRALGEGNPQDSSDFNIIVSLGPDSADQPVVI